MVVLVAPSTAGNTLGAYRQRLARAAGWHIFTSTTNNATAANQIVSTTLQSTEYDSAFLKDTWEYQPTGSNAGECRRVQSAGLAPGSGTVTLERGHSNPTPSGTAIELYGKLPPVDYEGRTGLNTIINWVLSECWTIQKLSIAAVTNQRSYGLGVSYPWIRDEYQIIEVYWRPVTSDVNDDDLLMSRWRYVPAADNPLLEVQPIGQSGGDLIKPMVYVPLSWWIQQNGAWGQPTTEGLVNDSDQGLLSLHAMDVIGLYYVYKELARWGDRDEQDRYEKLAAQQRVAANEWKKHYLPRLDGRDEHWAPGITVNSYRNGALGNLQVLSRG